MSRRKEEFARAAAAMLGRLRQSFETAATAFNRTSPSAPVTVASLKGAGFSVMRRDRRLTVLRTGDWNVAFSFSTPPRMDWLALLSRVEGERTGWRLCRKSADTDKLEEEAIETRDVAELITREL